MQQENDYLINLDDMLCWISVIFSNTPSEETTCERTIQKSSIVLQFKTII